MRVGLGGWCCEGGRKGGRIGLDELRWLVARIVSEVLLDLSC